MLDKLLEKVRAVLYWFSCIAMMIMLITMMRVFSLAKQLAVTRPCIP